MCVLARDRPRDRERIAAVGRVGRWRCGWWRQPLESPDQPEVIVLIMELDAYQDTRYPPESRHYWDLESLISGVSHEVPVAVRCRDTLSGRLYRAAKSVDALSSRQARNSDNRASSVRSALAKASWPSTNRSGGLSAQATAMIACAARSGSPGCFPL